MREISKLRFEALAGYARNPQAVLFAEEIAFFEDEAGTVVGMLIRDRSDNDFAGMAFGRDKKLRFRWISMTDFVAAPEQARDALAVLMAELAGKPDESYYQGDEVGEPIDFFTPVHAPEALHPDFMTVARHSVFSPARGIIEPMMRWHDDLDGNFVEQFQSTAFDQRIWELYLFATLTEVGFKLDAEHAVPDFIGRSLRGEVAIEAVTVGPTRKGGQIVPPPPLETEEEQQSYLKEYMPIKFGSPLFSKLKKKYWDEPQIAEMPLVFAVADFSSPGSMVYTASALERYLYGYEFTAAFDEHDNFIGGPLKLAEHRWGKKVIPSGFFNIPDAQHVSAVISTTAGTISKFNRMGLLGGFGSGDVWALREGSCVPDDVTSTYPLAFQAIVNAAGYSESWSEGLNVYHNPNADRPLSEDLFPTAAHHHCDAEGNRTTHAPARHPLASTTQFLGNVDVAKALAELEGPAIRFFKRSKEVAD